MNNILNKEIELENTKQDVSVHEFVKWCSDESNGLNKIKEISDVKYQLTYIPKESMALLELRNSSYTYNDFSEASTHYSEMTYFNLKIEIPKAEGEILKYNLNSPNQYEGRVKYLAFEMQNDIYLVQGTDTIKPGLYNYERIYEVAPFAKIMLAFDNNKFKAENEFSIVINDRLFEKGYIKFNYKDWQLKNVPNIIGL